MSSFDSSSIRCFTLKIVDVGTVYSSIGYSLSMVVQRVAAVCSVFLLSGCARDVVSVSPSDLSSFSSTISRASSLGSSASSVHPVSLPALMQKEFDGHDFTVGKVLAEHDLYTRHYITYRSGNLLISGIINIPKGDGPFPVLILNHGYIDPAVYTNGRGLKREQDYLARRGFIVVHPDYRNHAESDDDPLAEVTLRLGYIEDVINLVHALRASDLPAMDAERIGMMGHSMGGGVTMGVLVTQPDLVDAAVLYAPVSGDMVKNFNRWLKRRPEVASMVEELYGSPEDNPEFWRSVSSQTFFHRITAPIQIHQGTADSDVPAEWSRETEELMKQAEVAVELFEYDGAGHEPAPPAWTTMMELIAEFFGNHL